MFTDGILVHPVAIPALPYVLDPFFLELFNDLIAEHFSTIDTAVMSCRQKMNCRLICRECCEQGSRVTQRVPFATMSVCNEAGQVGAATKGPSLYGNRILAHLPVSNVGGALDTGRERLGPDDFVGRGHVRIPAG